MRCTLFEKQTPETVANFIGLATGTKDWKNPVSHVTKHNTPLYDGTIFHRVIPNFMIQGGDPAGNGSGDPGYTFKDEIVSTLTFDRPGRLAMANSGPSTNGSQFFITEVPTPHLNGRHTIFGQCDDATVAMVKQIARMASDPRDNRPFRPVKINHITIERGAAASTSKPAAKPLAKKPTAKSSTKAPQ
jgi:cyclophilin family peptidyl-prolyl cis-trans isomerase